MEQNMMKMYYKFIESFKYLVSFFQIESGHLQYLKAVFKYRLWREKEFPATYVRLKGNRFFARAKGMDIAHLSIFYEKETTDFILSQQWKTFLDVGAHTGRYVILARPRVCKILAFEPSIQNYMLLEKNLKLNGNHDNVKIFNIACSDVVGEKDLFFVEGNEGLTSLIKNTKSGDAKEKCAVDKLDNIVKKEHIEEVSLIKIDVEGAEINVLRGAEKILKDGSPVLILEIMKPKELKKIKEYLLPLEYFCTKLFDSRNYVFEKKKFIKKNVVGK